MELLARRSTGRFFGYAGAFLDFVTDGLRSGELLSESDTDAGLYYAGSAITVGLGGAALTYGATGAAVLLGPIGWIALGVVLTGTSIALIITGDAQKDDAVEKWLDACSFGQRSRPDAPTYNSLAEEMEALGLALHTPTLLDTDWSDKWGWPDYKAEAEIFLLGYNSSTSQVRVSANGKHLGPYVTSDGSGGIARLRFFLPKSEGVEKVRFEIRYRPDDRFDKDYILNFTVPETEAMSEDNDPRVSGP